MHKIQNGESMKYFSACVSLTAIKYLQMYISPNMDLLQFPPTYSLALNVCVPESDQ